MKQAVQLDLIDRGPKREHPTPMLVDEWNSKATTVSGNSALVNYKELPLGFTFRPGHCILVCPICKQPGEAKFISTRDRNLKQVVRPSADATRVIHSVEVVSGRTKVRSSCWLGTR
jgi:hypothetical protein